MPPLSWKQMPVEGTSGWQPPGSPTLVLLRVSGVGKQAPVSNCMWCLLCQHYESQDNETLHVASKPQSPGASGEKRILGQWGVTRWRINFYHFEVQTSTSPVTTDVVLSVHQIDRREPILQPILLSDLPLWPSRWTLLRCWKTIQSGRLWFIFCLYFSSKFWVYLSKYTCLVFSYCSKDIPEEHSDWGPIILESKCKSSCSGAHL